MKSENENIEEFDDLIRNISEDAAYSIQDGDWEQLQMMMEESRTKKIGWIWKGTVVLILISAGLLLVNRDSPIDKEMESMISIPESESVEQSKTEERGSANFASKSQGDLMDNTKGNIQKIAQSEEKAFFEFKEDNRTELAQKSIEKSEQALVVNSATEIMASVIIADNNQLNATADVEIDLSLVEEKNLIGVAAKEEGINEEELTKVVDPDTVALVSLISDAEPEPELLIEGTHPRVIDSVDSNAAMETIANRKMHFYFGVGTEWSLTSKMPIGTTKLKFQIGAEYQFHKKWSVLSGLNYTVKKYETNADGYTVEQGFWAGGIKPNRISAECNVIEIPLNVRYYFSAQDSRRSSFYLTAGASSYVMASERYGFTYDVEDPTLKPGWSGKWENVHYFSVLHLSAGYQKNLKRNCAVLFEPYVDLPMKGIGFGQVDLISFGLSLQFKY